MNVRRTLRFFSALLPVLGLLALPGGPQGDGAWAQTSNSSIGTASIEIDLPSANLYPSSPGSTTLLDWVKDSNPNTDPTSTNVNVVTGIEIGVTGAVKTGHWNGIRIVDGIGNNEQDIFLQGGKENDTSSWNIGPGSVGSSKYDITQAYLASNNGSLFFGMERRGNNGTTAFDFEFNQLPSNDPRGYIPNRSVGDVLFTFEMQGSGGSGSATPFIFKWNGTAYVSASLPAGTQSSINTSATPAAPWGYVDAKGSWVTGNLDRFLFAEASVPFGADLLPGVTSCGGTFYVQVRTRSSSVDTSDLKDTTKVFGVTLGGPVAAAQLTSGCGLSIDFSGVGSKLGDGSLDTSGSGLTYSWKFYPVGSTTVVATATTQSGTVSVASAGDYFAELTVTEGNCTSPVKQTNIVSVTAGVSVIATLTAQCDLKFDYSAAASGGNAPYTYSWVFKDANGTQVGTSSTRTGQFTAPSAGTYTAVVTASDTALPGRNGGASCTGTDTKSVAVYAAVTGTAAIESDCDATISGTASGSGGKAPYTYSWKLLKSGAVVKTSSDQNPVFTGLDPGTYSAEVTIQDSQSGLACKVVKTTGTVEVNPLPALTLKKTDPTLATVEALTLEVKLNEDLSSGPGTTTYKWVLANGTAISGATSPTLTLTYAQLKALAVAPTQLETVSASGLSFKALVYKIKAKLHVERTLAGSKTVPCEKDSPEIDLAMLKAVDP